MGLDRIDRSSKPLRPEESVRILVRIRLHHLVSGWGEWAEVIGPHVVKQGVMHQGLKTACHMQVGP